MALADCGPVDSNLESDPDCAERYPESIQLIAMKVAKAIRGTNELRRMADGSDC
jgi:hypothetical protein